MPFLSRDFPAGTQEQRGHFNSAAVWESWENKELCRHCSHCEAAAGKGLFLSSEMRACTTPRLVPSDPRFLGTSKRFFQNIMRGKKKQNPKKHVTNVFNLLALRWCLALSCSHFPASPAHWIYLNFSRSGFGAACLGVILMNPNLVC